MIYFLLLVGLVATASGDDTCAIETKKVFEVLNGWHSNFSCNTLNELDNFRQDERVRFENNLKKNAGFIVGLPEIKAVKAELDKHAAPIVKNCQEMYTNDIKSIEKALIDKLKESFDKLVEDTDYDVDHMKFKLMGIYNRASKYKNAKKLCTDTPYRPEHLKSLLKDQKRDVEASEKRIQSRRKDLGEMINLDKRVIHQAKFDVLKQIDKTVKRVQGCIAQSLITQAMNP